MHQIPAAISPSSRLVTETAHVRRSYGAVRLLLIHYFSNISVYGASHSAFANSLFIVLETSSEEVGSWSWVSAWRSGTVPSGGASSQVVTRDPDRLEHTPPPQATFNQATTFRRPYTHFPRHFQIVSTLQPRTAFPIPRPPHHALLSSASLSPPDGG
jgi:hypothetical protein